MKKNTATAAPAPTAPAPAPDAKNPRVYPPIEEFNPDILKELRAEFEALMANKSDPERLAFLRDLGMRATAYLKTKMSPAAQAAAKSTLPDLKATEIFNLAQEMNAVMSLTPPIDPGAGDALERMRAELADVRIEDFKADAKHPEKKQFSESAEKIIRKFGLVLPIDPPKGAKTDPKAEKAKRVTPPPGKRGPGPSSREVVYKAWVAGEKDSKKLMALVEGKIKEITLSTYLSDWSRGKYLPKCAESAV